VGICGGYQMLGREVRDSDVHESEVLACPGLGVFDSVTTIAGEKRTVLVKGHLCEDPGVPMDMALDDIVDFSANINPLGPPETVWRAIREALSWIRRYPDAKQAAVKAVLSRFTGVPEAWIVCGNGAVEAMDWIVRAWQSRRLVVFDPAFAEYEVIAHRLGIPVLHWPVWTRLGASLGRMAEMPVQDGDLVCFNTRTIRAGRCGDAMSGSR
jgi:hypothetical protein